MRVALCLSGQARTLEICAGSLRRCITGPYDCDVFAYLARDEDAAKIEALAPTGCEVADDPVFDERDWASRLGRGQHSGVQGVLRQLHAVKQCNELKRAQEREGGFRYDWVIRARPDSLFQTEIEDLDELDPGRVYVPRHDNWAVHGLPALNDRFAFGGSPVMDVYARRLDEVEAFLDGGALLHPETYLGAYLQRHAVPVSRTRVVSALLRKDGTRVAPHFDPALGDAP